ncbi:pleckstrin homology domain-containing family M member 1 [Arapaima gigas]
MEFDVISELENLNFINTDVGRCRAWVRLALNDGLVECYLASLLRENSDLVGYYQPTALMLDPEDREVLLSYLQGLGSLTFELSYKSAMLNEWTVTPLVLAGLCPADPVEPLPTETNSVQAPKCKDSWDTVSLSSTSSEVVEVQRGSGRHVAGRTQLMSSNLSLDTTGSSQLSSSLSSDSLLQGSSRRSPDKEPWIADLDIDAAAEDPRKAVQHDLVDFGGSTHSSEDSMQDESGLSSLPPEHLSEAVASSGSDSEPQQPCCPLAEAQPSTLCELSTAAPVTVDGHVPNGDAGSSALPNVQKKRTESSPLNEVSPPAPSPEVSVRAHRSESVLSRKTSVDSLHSPTTGLPKCRSWISEDDFYKPHMDEAAEPEEATCPNAEQNNGTPLPPMELESPQCPPSVVHRRQIGLSNPFRGLLKLGHLERRGAMGLWRRYYCELSPFELRLYQNDEERTCSENCSLLRCEDVCAATAEGRFELAFPGRRLLLRAASRDEAEDWVDRIVEAVNKCRRPAHFDDEWQVLEVSTPPADAETPAASAPPSPEHAALDSAELDWTRMAESEPEAIKETVLYHSLDDRSWTPLIFSLSLEALKAFQVQAGRKVLRFTHTIESVRDVVPDASLGSPAFFKVLTARETLKLRAQSEQEARSWRGLIRGALDSYLDSCEDGASAEMSSQGGNIYRLVQHSLREDAALLPHLYTVPTEKGLDAQNFRCAGCPRQIGFSFGKARLCEFSGQYYCESCHHGDVIVIPSRMVHNWDLVAREVSRPALRLLATVAMEPLLDLEALNPALCEHAEPMALVHSLRQQLRLLGDYLLACRSGALKRIQPKLDQRNYLLESCNRYSVTDLRQIADGQYEAFLHSLIQFASTHVYQCDLCTQRGFICQICNANRIIFPFEFDTTTRCKVCKAVYHSSCKADLVSCPRCLRLQKYLEREMQE